MRGGDRTYAVAAMALGFVAAVGVVSMGLLGGARAGVRTTDLVEARPSLDGRGAGVRGRMASALASAHARPLAARLAEVEPEADAGDVLDLAKGNNSTGNATNATAEVEEAPCTSWRGCFHGGDKNYTSLPSDIRFECGGKDAADTCYRATRACVHSAEVSLANMYVVSPILGTEARGYAVCKCFISNGCKPGCNVAMYQSELPRPHLGPVPNVFLLLCNPTPQTLKTVSPRTSSSPILLDTCGVHARPAAPTLREPCLIHVTMIPLVLGLLSPAQVPKVLVKVLVTY